MDNSSAAIGELLLDLLYGLLYGLLYWGLQMFCGIRSVKTWDAIDG